MDDLRATSELLSRQLTEAVRADALRALPVITALQRATDEHLREAVRHAAVDSSWKEIAAALGVSKQAAHQRFRTYAKDVAAELKTEHRSMERSRRAGDAEGAAQARARRDDLVAGLRAGAKALKDER